MSVVTIPNANPAPVAPNFTPKIQVIMTGKIPPARVVSITVFSLSENFRNSGAIENVVAMHAPKEIKQSAK